jgi:hypothetical protein
LSRLTNNYFVCLAAVVNWPQSGKQASVFLSGGHAKEIKGFRGNVASVSRKLFNQRN